MVFLFLFFLFDFWITLCIITFIMKINIKTPDRSWFISMSAFHFSSNSAASEKSESKYFLLLSRAVFSFQHIAEF